MQKIKNILTPSQLENLLSFVYQVAPPAVEQEIEGLIQHSEALRDEFYDLIRIKKELDASLMSPSESTIANILRYSRLPKPIMI